MGRAEEGQRSGHSAVAVEPLQPVHRVKQALGEGGDGLQARGVRSSSSA